MALVTVAIPARNAAAFIAQTIASIQQQTDIDWELILVDDASGDGTGDIVRAIDDSRIHVLTNTIRRGVSFCHNRIIAASSAPFVAHVDADDYILPGALRKLVCALQENPRSGLAHCQFYDIDWEGHVLRDVLRRRTQAYQQRASGFDYRRALIVHGTVTSGLRTYPRRVLDAVGKFNETMVYGEDLEMAVRIVDKYEIAFVPEYLYARRLHTQNTTESLSMKPFRFLWRRYQMYRALERSNQVTYFKQEPYLLNRLLWTALSETLAVPRAQALVKQILLVPRRLRRRFSHKIALPVLDRLYEFAVNYGGWWRLDVFRRRRTSSPLASIGYYLWSFPAPVETFIRREVQALRDSGLSVTVFADQPGGLNDPALVETTRYLLPRDPKRLGRAKQLFARSNRIRYWNVRLYVFLHRYGDYKTWHEDRYVFERAIDLAYVLKEHNITHLHAPWADRTAFIALLAACLLNIPYTVEARAHDLHRFKFQYALAEKFANAAFVITNSDYNARAIATYLESRTHPPVHVIRNLFPLEQFQPPAATTRSGPFRILCVARLIEEKGLVYLLRACAQLRERGISFTCEIIGGAEEPTYVSYRIQLLRLHKHLCLQDHVFFLGSRPFDQILDAYAHADLFVLPCVIAENGGRDISPNSLIEAMAMGLPVISTQLSAIPEIVEHGVSGILIPPNDAPALADAMVELIQDEPRRRALGARARERVQARYDARKNVAQFAALFASASAPTGAVQ